MKKEYRQLSLAILAAAVAFGIYHYLREKKPTPPEVSVEVSSPENTPPSEDETPLPENPDRPEATSETPAEATPDAATVTYDPTEIDELSKQQEALLTEFKTRIHLDIKLPGDVRYEEADVEGNVAVLQGASKGKKIALMAVAQTPSLTSIVDYLNEQKSRITVLGGQPFKISGSTKSYPGPQGSGISKMIVIPGGTKNNGMSLQAAYLERADKKGSYLLIMEANKTYFENADGDFDTIVDSLSVK